MRIIGMVVCIATCLDLAVQCGTEQLCVGIKCGIEGAVHAMCSLSKKIGLKWLGVLLVDATNAFKSLNRAVLLWNASVMWLRCSRFLFNAYQGWATLALTNFCLAMRVINYIGRVSMFLYTVGTLLLIHQLKNPKEWMQM